MLAPAVTLVLKRQLPSLPKNRSTIEMRRFLNTCEEPEPKKPKIELKMEKKSQMNEKDFQSMWDKGKCCQNTCETFRHDIKFLKPISNRIYTRTWNECENFVKESYRCIGENLPPEVEIRPRRSRQLTTQKPCVGNEFHLNLMKCTPSPKLNIPCRKIKMPGCRGVGPMQCTKIRQATCCQKRCTKYPSYSECIKPKPQIDKPVECICRKGLSLCDVYALLRKDS